MDTEAFKRQLANNPVSAYYVDRIFSNLEEKHQNQFDDALQRSTNRYLQIQDVKSSIENPDDIQSSLQTIFDAFPSFTFAVGSDLNRNPEFYKISKQLQIAGILSQIFTDVMPQSRTRLFLSNVDPEADLNALNDRILDQEEDSSYLPKLVYRDFLSIVKNHLKLKITKNLPTLIENMFYFSGLSQIFLRYYFDLLRLAPNDTFSQHVDGIFSRLFISLRLEEIRYWRNYKNSEPLLSKLNQTIERNAANERHPKLQKDVFARISYHHPIIHDGTSRGLTAEANNLLKNQVSDFHRFSSTQLSLLLNIILKLKGNDHVVYLLTHIFRTNKDTLVKLKSDLEKTANKSFDNLLKLVNSFMSRFFQPKDKSKEKPATSEVQLSQGSSRLSTARKNLLALKDRKGMMTYDKVAGFLERRLKRLYQRVKKEGALTQDKIPEYLARFAEAAQPVIAEANPKRRKEAIETFEESTVEILQEISDQGGLTVEEADDLQNDIHEQVQELQTPDVEKRAEIVENIGLTLSEAADKVEEVEEPEEKKSEIDVEAFIGQELIPAGFDKTSTTISIKDFFSLPFANSREPEEDNWFEAHLQYCRLAVEKNKLEQSTYETIVEILPSLPKSKYKKYFNIFPSDELEETTFYAVYDIWANDALDRIRLKE
ncbi:MAG: hypothetical protein GY866_27710 [Proteobacteria bacterium]|nr:hypothetical protein [Pseudomonadota bacterium]